MSEQKSAAELKAAQAAYLEKQRAMGGHSFRPLRRRRVQASGYTERLSAPSVSCAY
jgi:hypothetical protein